MKVKLRTLLIMLGLGAGLGIAGAGMFIHFGVYNISATEQHTAPVYKLFDYAMRRSVKSRAASIVVPDLNDPGRITNGLVHYRAHCLQCHGAPGVAPQDLAYGMKPMPANLVSTAREWKASDIFWVVKHGIKMSGMPAWEYRISDDEIWSIVAFVKKLPELSTEDYAALDRQAAEPHGHHHEGEQHGQAPQQSNGMSIALGNIEAGKRAVQNYLCSTCHQIPGLAGANAHVGPPLNGIATRQYIGGIIPNNPENMVRWLQNPKQFDPQSAMPSLGISEKDAKDIAAFLYQLDAVE